MTRPWDEGKTKQAQTIQELQMAQVSSQVRVLVVGAATRDQQYQKGRQGPSTKGLIGSANFSKEELSELFISYLRNV